MHALLEEFCRRGIDVSILTSVEGSGAGGWAPPDGVTMLSHPSAFTRAPRSALDPLLYANRVQKWLEERSDVPAPSLVLCFSYYYAIAAKRTWPRAQVWFLPGGAMWDWFNDLHAHRHYLVRLLLRPKRRLAVWAEGVAVRLADRILVESTWLQDRLASFHGRALEEADVLPAPVDTARFRPSLEHRRAMRGELGIDEDCALVLALGRLDSRKNYTTLLRALPHLKSGNWRLVVVGHGPEQVDLQNLARGLGLGNRVLFAGPRDDPERVYAAADIYCQPSLWESYSNALQEAVASGLPCIVSKTNVNRDLQEGLNVLLADPTDPNEWAAKIDFLLQNPREASRMSAASRRFAEGRPSWSELTDWLLSEFARATTACA